MPDTVIVNITENPVNYTVNVSQGAQGDDGDSAYQLWIAAGNSGTVQEFLDSLIGTDGNNGNDGLDGNDGLSAYQIWINEGNTGTVQDFLDSLVGLPGNDGTDGNNGNDGTNVTITTTTDQGTYDAATPGATELVILYSA